MGEYEVATMNWQNPFRIKQAAQVVSASGVIAYPTEAVWGLGCCPFDESAVNRLLQLKGRAEKKGLILVAANIQQFQPFIAHLNESQISQLNSTWPGPTTWLVPIGALAMPWITGEHQSIALRVSSHPTVQLLCEQIGSPIVSTSANIKGRHAARTALGVRKVFGRSVDFILPGCVGGATMPSEIRDLVCGEVVRSGG